MTPSPPPFSTAHPITKPSLRSSSLHHISRLSLTPGRNWHGRDVEAFEEIETMGGSRPVTTADGVPARKREERKRVSARSNEGWTRERTRARTGGVSTLPDGGRATAHRGIPHPEGDPRERWHGAGRFPTPPWSRECWSSAGWKASTRRRRREALHPPRWEHGLADGRITPNDRSCCYNRGGALKYLHTANE